MVFYQWWQDSRRNPFLFWAILAGFITIFPTLYIPVINHKVFKHEGISWEWGIVIVESILFFFGCEVWKWIKRAYFRRVEKKPLEGLAVRQKSGEGDEGRDLEKHNSPSSRNEIVDERTTKKCSSVQTPQ
jgi:magnesium-transporting ATPase (P-type)